MYDFANSAFATTILTALLPFYVSKVVIPGDDPVSFMGISFVSDEFWGYLSSFGALLILMLF